MSGLVSIAGSSDPREPDSGLLPEPDPRPGPGKSGRGGVMVGVGVCKTRSNSGSGLKSEIEPVWKSMGLSHDFSLILEGLGASFSASLANSKISVTNSADACSGFSKAE